jgi:hypothetical protein
MAIRARVSVYTFDPADPQSELRAAKRDRWTEAVSAETGHLGELAIETDDGRQIVIHLWEDESTADAARVANNPRLRELVMTEYVPDYDRLWTREPEHVMGTVLTNTVTLPKPGD